jgi:hypothetical protein
MRTPRTLVIWPRILIALVVFLFVTIGSAVNFPSWWTSQGILNLDNANVPVPPDDFAALNQGQLKNFALGAFKECEAKLPGGAGLELTQLFDSFTEIVGGQRVPKTSTQTEDFAVATVGQLKAMAQPFYDRFSQVGLGGLFPWPAFGTARNFAVANLGQAKAIFSFDLSLPTAVPAPNPVDAIGVSTTSIQIAWTAVPGATSYRIERKLPFGTGAETQWVFLATVDHTVLEYLDTGLVQNRVYAYRVATIRNANQSQPSREARSMVQPSPGDPDPDSDTDGIPDRWEVIHGLNPANPLDAAFFAAGGLTYLQKYQLGLDPDADSTANDGVSDGWKVDNGVDPHSVVSTARDGLPDSWKQQYGLDPTRNVGGEDPDEDDFDNVDEFELGMPPNDYYNGGEPYPVLRARWIFPNAFRCGFRAPGVRPDDKPRFLKRQLVLEGTYFDDDANPTTGPAFARSAQMEITFALDNTWTSTRTLDGGLWRTRDDPLIPNALLVPTDIFSPVPFGGGVIDYPGGRTESYTFRDTLSMPNTESLVQMSARAHAAAEAEGFGPKWFVFRQPSIAFRFHTFDDPTRSDSYGEAVVQYKYRWEMSPSPRPPATVGWQVYFQPMGQTTKEVIESHDWDGSGEESPTFKIDPSTFNSGSYGAYSVSRILLSVDADRDGLVDDEKVGGKTKVTLKKGALFMANTDADKVDGEKQDGATSERTGRFTLHPDRAPIDNSADESDIAHIMVSGFVNDVRTDPSKKVKLRIGQIADLQGIRLFKAIAANEAPIWGPGVHDTEEFLDITQLIEPNKPLILGIEGLYFAGVIVENTVAEFDGEIDIELGIEAGGVFQVQDKVRMHVVPWLMIGNNEPRDQTYATTVASNAMKKVNVRTDTTISYTPSDSNATFLTSTSMSATAHPQEDNHFTQDDVEIGYAHLPGAFKTYATLRLSVPEPNTPNDFPNWPKATSTLFGSDLGLFSIGDEALSGSQDLGGNLELLPPSDDAPLGRIICGNNVSPKLLRFLNAQKLDGQFLQKPIQISVDWLGVGHVDEVFGFTGRKIGNTDEVVVASPRKAYDILRTLSPTTLLFSDDGNPLAAEIQAYNPGQPNQIQLKAGPSFSGNWIGKYVRIYEGAGRGLVGRISSLTSAGLLTVDRVWATGYTVKGVSTGFGGQKFEHSLVGGSVLFGADWTVVRSTPLPAANDKVVLFSDTLFYWLKRIPLTPDGDPDPDLDAPPAAITVREILQDSDLEECNIGSGDSIQNIITNEVEGELTAEASVTFREVPVLFCEYPSGHPFVGKAHAFTTNLANCQPLSADIAFPKPWGPRVGGEDKFEVAIQTVANKVFVDTWLWYHLFDGEVHCATATKRQFPSADWWTLFP